MKALLIIDVQKGYIERYGRGLLDRINQRILRAVENRALIIYVKNVRRLRRGKRINELAEGLNVSSSYIVCKETASALKSEEMLGMLKENHITEIEIIGIDGNSCVAGSAEDALRYGYKVILPCSCIGAINMERFKKVLLSLAEKGIAIL